MVVADGVILIGLGRVGFSTERRVLAYDQISGLVFIDSGKCEDCRALIQELCNSQNMEHVEHVPKEHNPKAFCFGGIILREPQDLPIGVSLPDVWALESRGHFM